MKKTSVKTIVLALAAIQGFTGCAVSQGVIAERATAVKAQIQERVAAQTDAELPLVEKVKGVYLSTSTTPLAYDATLPPVFRDVTFVFPGRASLATIAERITAATKLPVQIRPDVHISMKSLVKGGDQAKSEQTPAATAAAPLPGASATGKTPAGAVSTTATAVPQLLGDYETSLPMDYTGSLAGYLNFICGKLGISWEYKSGTIVLYRLATRIYTIKASPGEVAFGSGMSKGGTSGASGNSGSFESTSSSTLKGDFSVWTNVQAAIKGMLSPLGTVTVDQASGTAVVTDTKEHLDTVSKYIDQHNATLTRRVHLTVRVLRVATSADSSMGVDFDLLYKRMAAGSPQWALGLKSAGSLANANAGELGMNVLSSTSRFDGSTILVKALNEMGTVVYDKTTTAEAVNRTPTPIASYSSTGYLAETTPATGGGTTGGQGVPGLKPGSVTTGFFLNVLPTAYENGSVLLRMSLDQSHLTKMSTISTGSGATLQSIQTPDTEGTKTDHSVSLREGESLVLMGITSDTMSGNARASVSGASQVGTHAKETQIIIVTPRVRAGI